MNQNAGNHGSRTLLYFFLAGAATGATVALLTAPQSGAETRRKLKQAKEHLADRASRVGSAIGEAYRSASTAGKEGFVRTMNGSPARASGSIAASNH
jgi:gas vesicle protein